MKKLEDIPKKEIFTVPEGYFDKLPGIIQSRVATREKSAIPVFQMAFRYALPVLIIGVAVFWFMKPGSDAKSAEGILAGIETTDLIAYLEETDLSTDELLDHVVLDGLDAEEIESEVYTFDLSDTDVDAVLDEMNFTE